MATQIDDELIESLEQLYSRFQSLNKATGSSDQALKELIQSSKQLSQAEKQRSLQTLEEVQRKERERRAEERRSEGYKILGNSIKSVATSMGSLTTGILGARDAFTAVTPIITSTADFFSKLVQGLTKVTTGFSIFGFSLGKSADGLAEIVGLGLDISSKLVSENLRLAQTITNSFTKLSESGVVFASSLDNMIRSSSEAGLTIDRFVEFVSKNNQALSGLAGNVGGNAVMLLKMGKNIGQVNRALLVSYGSYEALADGVAQYADLQRQLGYVDLRNQEQLTRGATDYLIRQRELTTLTGKRADQLREEERRRNQELDYALKKGRLNEVQQRNLEATMGIAARFGPEAEAYIKEFFATGGRVVSQQAVTFAAMQEPVARTLEQILTGAREFDATGFRNATATILQQNAPALQAFAKSIEELASINRAAMNPIITGMATTGAAILGNMNLLKDATKLFAEIGKTADQLAIGKVDQKMTAAAAAIDQLIVNQRKLDQLASDSIMDMKKFLEYGYYFQGKMIDMTRLAGALLGEITSDRPVDKERLAALAKELLGITDAPQPSNPEAPGGIIISPEFRALGGVANEPVIAGEAGPEAIIPLAHGDVPLDIDWTPMIKAIMELTAKVDETNDINRRILNASY